MKTVLLIDGGYLRASYRRPNREYNNAFIETFAQSCFIGDEYLLRIFYYDAPLFRGDRPKPVSGEMRSFQSSDKWLVDLAKRERFAVRQGTLGFRGWRLRQTPLEGGGPLTDADFEPVFEQKGVDMRIGLDIAVFSANKSVDRVLLVSGDTDMIPAMKHARKAGLEVGLVQLPHPTLGLHNTLKAHADFVRHVAWPAEP